MPRPDSSLTAARRLERRKDFAGEVISAPLCSPLAVTEDLVSNLEELLDHDQSGNYEETFRAAQELAGALDSRSLEMAAPLLIRTCVTLFEVNRSTDAINLGRTIAGLATQSENIQIQRRIYNVLGSYYGDIADFTAAMQCLQQALSLAKKIGDPVIEAACLANVATLMQEMGHYRQAIDLCRLVLDLQGSSAVVRGLKTQCSSTGLFSAHRIGDSEAARYFLDQGQTHLEFAFGELGRAFFEKDRVLYLIDADRGQEAQAFIEASAKRLTTVDAAECNQRVQTLLTISRSLCAWSLGQKAFARTTLGAMYLESKRSRLYHHWVLQALIKIYSDAFSAHDVTQGLTFARELVEYTTSVKKAKFYRQLASRRVSSEVTSASPRAYAELDPFALAKDWLRDTDVGASPDDLAPGEKFELAKHEELTAIHDDMARLRARGIRRDIRTGCSGHGRELGDRCRVLR